MLFDLTGEEQLVEGHSGLCAAGSEASMCTLFLVLS